MPVPSAEKLEAVPVSSVGVVVQLGEIMAVAVRKAVTAPAENEIGVVVAAPEKTVAVFVT